VIINTAYLTDSRVAIISKSFTHKMAVKAGGIDMEQNCVTVSLRIPVTVDNRATVHHRLRPRCPRYEGLVAAAYQWGPVGKVQAAPDCRGSDRVPGKKSQ